MTERQIVQCRLRNGKTTMTTWLDARKDLRVGNYVTLKNQDGLWRVERIGDPRAAGDVNRGWTGSNK